MNNVDSEKFEIGLAKQWLHSNAVAIGSEALGVASSRSDLDYVLCEEAYTSFKKAFPSLKVRVRDARSYFNILPLGNSRLVSFTSYLNQGKKVDIIVYPNQEDVDITRECMDILKTLPKELLIIKEFRVNAFMMLLQTRGFIDDVKSSGEWYGI